MVTLIDPISWRRGPWERAGERTLGWTMTRAPPRSAPHAPSTALPPVSHSLPLSVSVTVSGLTRSPALRLSQPVPLSLGACLCLHGLSLPLGGLTDIHIHSFIKPVLRMPRPGVCVCGMAGLPPATQASLKFAPHSV